MSKLQTTLALLKPDIAANPVATKAIINRILSQGFSIVRSKTLYWTRKDAEKFYAQHQGRFFYQRLVEYTTCGPVTAMILSKDNAIQAWRDMIGPTKTFKAKIHHPYTLRGEKGLTDTRNSAHGSDSPASARVEIAKVFLESDLAKLSSKSEHKDRHFITEDTINSSLGLQKTWSEFYARRPSGEAPEWFVGSSDIKNHIMTSYTTATKKGRTTEKAIILDIGCGSSFVGPEIAKELGPEAEVYSLDFTPEALSSLQYKTNKESSFDHITNWHLVCADITASLPFIPASVSVIIDKGGTDSVLKQQDGGRLHKRALSNLLSLLHQGGVYVHISDQGPEVNIDTLRDAITRAGYQDSAFDVSCTQLPTDTRGGFNGDYFLYSVNKM